LFGLNGPQMSSARALVAASICRADPPLAALVMYRKLYVLSVRRMFGLCGSIPVSLSSPRAIEHWLCRAADVNTASPRFRASSSSIMPPPLHWLKLNTACLTFPSMACLHHLVELEVKHMQLVARHDRRTVLRASFLLRLIDVLQRRRRARSTPAHRHHQRSRNQRRSMLAHVLSPRAAGGLPRKQD
jgi:hypothetical protein